MKICQKYAFWARILIFTSNYWAFVNLEKYVKISNSCVLPILPVLPACHTYKAFFSEKRTTENQNFICSVWSRGKTGIKSAYVILSKWPFYPNFRHFFKIRFLAEMGSLTHPSCPAKSIFQKDHKKYENVDLLRKK